MRFKLKFQKVNKLKSLNTSAGVVDRVIADNWNNIKTGLLKTTEEVCGTTLPHHWRRETWWWNEHVEKAIAAKQKAFKAWKTGKALGHHTNCSQTQCQTCSAPCLSRSQQEGLLE